MRFPLVPCAALLAALIHPLRADQAPGAYPPLNYHPLGTHGQALVDMEMAKHPELKLITVHITPLGVPADSDADRCIMCSSIGRIGKPDAGPDADVVRTGKEVIEFDRKLAPGANPFGQTAGPKYEVLNRLVDRSGRTVGLLVVVFPWKEGDDIAREHATALQIGNDFKAQTASKDDLLRPAS